MLRQENNNRPSRLPKSVRKFITLILYFYWWIKAPRFGFFLKRGRSPIHLTRFYMYHHLESVLSKLSVHGHVLSISGRGPIVDMLGTRIAHVEETEYPEVDIQALPYMDSSFDVVISDQVLEHVFSPAQAVKESVRVVRPDGLIIHTTCFMNPIHLYPLDLWRFSPTALAHLAGNAKVIEAGGWGNRSALLFVLMDVGHHLIPVHPDHPLHRIALHNDERFPIVTWIIARKPNSLPNGQSQ
jgi:SAM-dependent methyltransferase